MPTNRIVLLSTPEYVDYVMSYEIPSCSLESHPSSVPSNAIVSGLLERPGS